MDAAVAGMAFFEAGRRLERVLLVALAAVVCVPSLAAAQDAPETYSVKGVVLNSLTRQPIARALVDGRDNAVLTDNDGRFVLNLPEGTAEVRVKRPGYDEGRENWHAIQVSANTGEVSLYLTPSASITGHLTLSGGDPPDDIRFIAFRRRSVDGHARWTTAGVANTSGDGVFRFAQLEAPANYLVCSFLSSNRPGGSGRGVPVYGYPPVCHPGNTDFQSAIPLALAAGEQADVEFTIARQRFYPVSIAMPNRPDRQGTAPIRIRDLSGRLVESGARWNEQLGMAEVDLPNGSYYAEARSATGKIRDYGRVDFKVAGAPVSGLSLIISPLHPVAVQIRKEFTANAGDGRGAILQDSAENDTGPGVNIMLTAAESTLEGQMGTNLHRQQGSSDSSLYEFDVPTPGRYWVRATAFQGHVSSITSGGVDLAREPLTIGTTTAPIDITLRNDGGSIECTLNAPGGSAAAESGVVAVYAIPLFQSASAIPQAMGQGGEPLTISELAPGSYRVVAFDKFQDLSLDDPQELARLTAKGSTVNVQAGSSTRIRLDLVRTSQGESIQ